MKLTVDFDVKTDPNTDQILAQMRTQQANSQLPTDVTLLPALRYKRSTSAPMLMVSLSSPVMEHICERRQRLSRQLRYYINLVDQITRQPGVAPVSLFSGQASMRCGAGSGRTSWAKLGVTVPQIAVAAIQAQTSRTP